MSAGMRRGIRKKVCRVGSEETLENSQQGSSARAPLHRWGNDWCFCIALLGIITLTVLVMPACDASPASAAATNPQLDATSDRDPKVEADAAETAIGRGSAGTTSTVSITPTQTISVEGARDSFDRDQAHPGGGGLGLNCLLDLPHLDPRHQASFVEWRPDSSEVLFNLGSDIYAVSPDGRRLRAVATGRPTVSYSMAPDGSEVVYTTCEFQDPDLAGTRPWLARPELALIDLDKPDSPAEQLTTNDVFDYYPSWSPDGQQIAFFQGEPSASIRDKAAGAVNRMRANGTSVLQLHGQVFVLGPPSWSPDGQWLAIVKDEGDAPAGLYLVRRQDGLSRRLTDTLSRPSWSPDSQRLAYVRREGDAVALYAQTLENSAERRIATIEFAFPPEWIPTVAWSPTGKHILYTCQVGICVVTPDGMRTGELRFRGEGVAWTLRREAAAWSPDGTRIAVVVASGQQRGIVFEARVFSSVPDGGDLRPLVTESNERGFAAWLATDLVPSGDLEICDSKFVIYNPAERSELVKDCETLIDLRQALLGEVALYWHERIPLDDWVGIAVSGTPQRITGLWLDRLDVPGRPGPLPANLRKLNRLQVLQLNNNQFTGPIPTELGGLTELQVLDLAGNVLTGSIPPELGQLAKLTRLDLRDNQLTGPIPAELGQIQTLKVLLLAGNSLTGCIPPALASMELQETDLDHIGLPACEPAT